MTLTLVLFGCFSIALALSKNSEFVCELPTENPPNGQCWSNRLCNRKDYFCKTNSFGCTKYNQCPTNCIDVCVKRTDFMIKKVSKK
jgi:hypothetical protein